MAYDREMQVALEAVRQACRLCQAVQQSLVTDDTIAKKDRSPVTVADFGAQAVVSHLLQQAFPDDPLVGEEDAAYLRDPRNAAAGRQVVDHVQRPLPTLSAADVLAAIDRGQHTGGPTGRHWTLDPIDGTKGFLRGDQYAVALGLIENGQVRAGVLGCPNLPVNADQADGPCGCVFYATRDGGAFFQPLDGDVDPVAVQTSRISSPAQAVLCESVESAHSAHDDSARIAAHLGITTEPFRIDSQCKYAAVARGNASIYLRMPTRADYEEKIWDHAAGAIIVEEAGGKVTDIHGKPLDFSIGRTLRDNKGIAATCGTVHDEVVAAIAAVMG